YEDFEKDLAILKKKMAAFERVSRSADIDPEHRLSEFAQDAQAMASIAIKNEPPMQPVHGIVSIISQRRMAKALLDLAYPHNVHLVESEQTIGARYDREGGKILIHPDLGESESVLLAVRELRRHWQHRKGVMIQPLTFHPDQAILINRSQNADLSVAMIRAA